MSDRIEIIVAARMSSNRAPGKVLRSVGGRPLLSYLLDRLGRCTETDDITVATSVAPSDDRLARYCAGVGVRCIRGPLDDVAARFAAVLRERPMGAFVRISGDSPLLDPGLVDRAVALFRSWRPDLVSNVHPRSFPKGQSVEVISADAFSRALPEMTQAADREHVTPFFYRHGERFHIVGFEAPSDLSGHQLSVDTEADFAAFRDLVGRMTRPHWSYGFEDAVRLVRDGTR